MLLAVAPTAVWLVGDTPTDVETARAAGALSVGVTWGFRTRADLEAAGAQRENSYMVLARAADLMSSIKDAETGYRGYLLTRDESFLQPYFKVRDGLRGKILE